MDGQTDRQMEGLMDGWTDRQLEGLMDEWTDRQTDKQTPSSTTEDWDTLTRSAASLAHWVWPCRLVISVPFWDHTLTVPSLLADTMQPYCKDKNVNGLRNVLHSMYYITFNTMFLLKILIKFVILVISPLTSLSFRLTVNSLFYVSTCT